MRDVAPRLPIRIYRKLRSFILYPKFREYVAQIGNSHPLHGIPTRIVGDASADPTEFFDHYDGFAYWASKKIFAKEGRLSILDIGSVKMANAILSIFHDITALVLIDCGDRITPVNYVRHDVADNLPFSDHSFDVFTSMVSLPLLGLGRYGDKLNSNSLVNLVDELKRVMKPNAELLFSMCLGKNVLNFNNGWFFDMPTIKRLFDGWELVDFLVDNKSSPKGDSYQLSERYSKDSSVESVALGDYRVVFLHFRRPSASE